jgi:hypothetical protein
MLMQAQESLFLPTFASVCAAHIEDDFLRKLFRRQQALEPCRLCGRRRTAVALDHVLTLTVSMIRSYRGRALDDLYFDDEGPYGFAISDASDTSETIFELFEGGVDDNLREFLEWHVEDDTWYKRSSLWLEGEELLIHCWQQFAEASRNEVVPEPSPSSDEAADGIPYDQMLDRLSDIVELLDLIRPATYRRWIRAVPVPLGDEITPGRIGTVPNHRARALRMNRAGEGTFYGAADEMTALSEIRAAPDNPDIVIGEWRPTRPLNLLDITRLPPLPSFYDLGRKLDREMLLFLREFGIDISKDVADVKVVGLEPVPEYRPTQAVTAHLRDRFSDLDGIVYASSKTKKRCCALFVPNAECASDDGRLELRRFVRRRAER